MPNPNIQPQTAEHQRLTDFANVKEYYFYLDGTPTHSYQKMLYKYPQVEYPYGRLLEENQRRAQRIAEADEFYAALAGPHLSVDERLVQRQALAGITWSKQFYHYSVERWLDGDPGCRRRRPVPPPGAHLSARPCDRLRAGRAATGLRQRSSIPG